MRTALLFVVRTQAWRDSSQRRREHFRVVCASRKSLGIAYGLIERRCGNRIKTLICFFYGFATAGGRLRYREGGLLAVHGKRNEESKIREICGTLGEVEIDIRGIRPRFGLAAMRASYSRGELGKIWRVLSLFSRRYPLFVAMRAAAALAAYLSLKARFKGKRPAAILISTDSNPHGLALMGVGDCLDIPVIFASHGAIAHDPARIRCALGLFYGRAATEALERSRVGTSLYYGFQDAQRKLASEGIPRRICVCLSIAFDPDGVRDLIRHLLSFRPERIVVRCHPDSLAKLPFAEIRISSVVQLSSGGPLEKDLLRCDLAVCGNSTVHLDALLQGVPAVFVSGIDSSRGLGDQLAFLREGVVPEWVPGERLDVSRHYAEPGWEARFGRYMNVTESREEFQRRLRSEVDSLLEGDHRPRAKSDSPATA